MFYGVKITSGLQDWQVLQRHGGQASAALKGRWELEKGALRAGVSGAVPVWRLVNEADQTPVIPWTACDRQTGGGNWSGEEAGGEWEAEITLPQGGPYRLETSLDAVSLHTGEHWMFRGDIRVHLGVGDVFCMAGQSNAAGYAKGPAYDPPDVRVRLLRNSGRWDMAAHPMNDATDAADCVNAPMGITGTSPFLSFGRRYADYTGLPVGLIQAAQGGSPIRRWDSVRDGDLFRNMLEKIGPSGDVRAILWYQGCADADAENAALYAGSFSRLVEETRAAVGWRIPFFTMQLNRYETQTDADSWAKIKESQRRAAEELPDVWLLPTSGLPQSDEIHNSAAGNVTLGEMLARQVHGALNGGPRFEAPALCGIRTEKENVTVRFRNTRGLLRLRPLHDIRDFILRDEKGEIPLTAVLARGDSLVLTPERPPEGKAFLSYGCMPRGPEGLIVDQETYLPVIPFDRVEVSR